MRGAPDGVGAYSPARSRSRISGYRLLAFRKRLPHVSNHCAGSHCRLTLPACAYADARYDARRSRAARRGPFSLDSNPAGAVVSYCDAQEKPWQHVVTRHKVPGTIVDRPLLAFGRLLLQQSGVREWPAGFGQACPTLHRCRHGAAQILPSKKGRAPKRSKARAAQSWSSAEYVTRSRARSSRCTTSRERFGKNVRSARSDKRAVDDRTVVPYDRAIGWARAFLL